jgi:hypothetical protein
MEEFKMSLKRIMLYVLTGFCMGAITLAMLEKMGFRIASYGVEMLFIPCVVLCICFGWALKTDVLRLFRRNKNVNSRRK